MSYNIHHGKGMDGQINLNRIAQIINNYSPDFVALQEVDEEVRRSSGQRQAEILAKATNMNYGCFMPSINYGGGKYGNAFLSRIKPEEAKFISLPYTKEARTAQLLSFRFLGAPLFFINTHFDLALGNHAKSLEVINNAIGEKSGFAAVLLGDLNAAQNSSTTDLLKINFLLNKPNKKHNTFPANIPKCQIDYILPKKNPHHEWSIRYLVPVENIASDHRPIIAKIRLCH